MSRLHDDRGVSESVGVAALVLLTVAVTASVGVGVLVIDAGDESEFDASFSFDYFSSRAALLITYENGSQLRASNVEIRGQGNNVTWATLGNLNRTATIGPGDGVQLIPDNAWGRRISGDETIEIVYVEGENESVLGAWSGSDA